MILAISICVMLDIRRCIFIPLRLADWLIAGSCHARPIGASVSAISCHGTPFGGAPFLNLRVRQAVRADKALRDAAKAGKPVDWQAVPAESKLLIIPRERFKSNAEHHVPLSGDALQIIAQ
jgi:hypothetical protein